MMMEWHDPIDTAGGIDDLLVDERDIEAWVTAGHGAIDRYLARHAAFDRWCSDHYRRYGSEPGPRDDR